MTSEPIIIGLTGRAHTGKDTAADHLVREYGFGRAAFADTLRTMLEAMLEDAGADYAHLYEPHLKAAPIPQLGGVSARELMQTLGTEWGRAQHGANWWLHLLQRRLGLHDGGSPVHDRIVITDVRFPNEAAFIQLRGGRIIKLHREQAPTVRSHASEADIDALPCDADLANNGPTLHGLFGLLDATLADWDIERRHELGPAYGGFL
jgi:hypothetical protein